jgi:GntR family transcriptional repressor for pyruvate dehydrogenase complex
VKAMEIKTINKQYIVDEVYQQIIDKINENIWESGEKIPSEMKLCEMLGVSRTSIRSALQKLSAYGIIETRHGQGSFVSDFAKINILNGINIGMNMSDKEILDMLEFRETIEFKCIELAVERATEEDVLFLEKALNKMIENIDDYKKYSMADFEFHLVFAKASKNDVLYHVMKNTKSFYYYLEELNRVFGVNKGTVEGHQKQYQLFKSRDAEGIKNEIRRGMEETHQLHQKGRLE